MDVEKRRVIDALMALAVSSITFRRDQDEDKKFNADSALLLTIPHLARQLFDVSNDVNVPYLLNIDCMVTACYHTAREQISGRDEFASALVLQSMKNVEGDY